jgi:DNA-binding CsgD family transcriptional regulator
MVSFAHIKVSPERPVISHREAEVLKHIGQGLRSKAIAEKLGLSIKTIETYKEHLKTRLNCEASDLPIAAVQLGLVKIVVTGQLRPIYPDLCD